MHRGGGNGRDGDRGGDGTEGSPRAAAASAASLRTSDDEPDLRQKVELPLHRALCRTRLPHQLTEVEALVAGLCLLMSLHFLA